MSIIIITILHLIILSSCTHTVLSGCDSCNMHQYITQSDHKLEQRNKRFWQLNEQSASWVEVQLPRDLVSCTDGDCTIVSSIREASRHGALPVRKSMSLTKMSETSVWVTGESGSIYERFWNGVQWVIAPHHLPLSAGYAVSVFMVNQTILALSGSGSLYQMQLTEDSQPNPIWVQFIPNLDDISQAPISSGVVLNDGE